MRARILHLLATVVLVSCGQLQLVQAESFARICGIDKDRNFTVAFDEESGDYAFVHNISKRNLLPSTPMTSAIRVTHEANATMGDTVFLVRQCSCVPGVYCHIDLDACGIPLDYSEGIGCFVNSPSMTLLRNAWPLVLLWYATLLFFLLCTERGRFARHFIWYRCFGPTSNERLVDQFLFTYGFTSTNPFPTNDPSQIPVTWLPIARPVETREPIELVLRTRIFQAPTVADDYNDNYCEDDDDNDYDATCTICFAALQQGDRVGKLTCNHTFHVHCLREWLPRRNVCPLCQTCNAATPRYADDDDPANNNSSDSSETTQQRRPPTDAQAEGHVELATIEAAVVEIEDPRPRGTDPRSVRQMVEVTRIWNGRTR